MPGTRTGTAPAPVKRNSVLGRLFGLPDRPLTPQPPNLARPIEGQIDQYRHWQRAGCPVRSAAMTPLMAELVEAATSTDSDRLGALAGHDSAWVRLGVAGNRHARQWTLFGDCKISFGLADPDEDPWVAATAVLRCRRPPTEIITAIRQAAVAATETTPAPARR